MKKIIPCLDTREGKLVKGVNFVNVKELGDPLEFAVRYDQEGADELIILDITKTETGHDLRTKMISEIAAEISIPLTVGGGIASLEDIQAALSAGASGVSISTAAVRNPDLIDQASARFGAQTITIAVDVALDEETEDYYIYTKGGSQREEITALDWLKECQQRGAGRFLITSINHDGVKEGFDIEFLAQAAQTVELPIIASGGAGNAQHFVDLFQQTGAAAGLAASIFHQGELSIGDLKRQLQAEGIDVDID